MRMPLFKRIACLFLAAALPLLAGCSGVTFSLEKSGQLVVTEVVSSNRRSLLDEAIGSPDWIELYNGTETAINLKGYGLSDNLRDLHKFVFPDLTIQPGEYLVVFAANDSGAIPCTVPCTEFGLSKSGDYLFLTDPYFKLLQQLEIPALVTDASYARTADGQYGYCALPTPGKANDTPIVMSLDALVFESHPDTLRFSEVYPNKSENGYPWVELYNLSDTPTRLDNYYLSDASTNYTRWQLPDCTLEAHGYVVVYLSGLGSDGGDFHSSFKLSKGEQALYIANLAGELLSTVTWDAEIPDGVSVIVSGDSAKYTAYPTPGAANSDRVLDSIAMRDMDATDPVRINEVLRSNKLSITDADGDRSEWVELKNSSAAPVSLAGYYLSDNRDNLYKWALPDRTIEAGGYLVIFLSGKSRTEGELHASFGLGDDENVLYLTKLDGLRLDSMPVPTDTGRNVSVGRTPDGSLRYYAQPTPGYENAYGFESADSIGFFNNNGVYISEVSAVSAAKSDQNDWFELYNGSSRKVDLTGWRISDDPDDPGAGWTFPALSIAAGGYLVIETTSHTTRWKDGVATLGLSPSGETLALFNAAGAEIDRFETGVLAVGRTSGRIEGDTTVSRVFFSSPTKGSANNVGSAYTGYAAQPVFSDYSLYRTGAFDLAMTSSTPGATIYYTTNGSKPTTASKRYTDPIHITKNTPVRAIAVAPGLLTSDVTTATYLFESPHTVPVVCVNMDPTDFRTVYAVTNRNKKIERETHISYYESNGQIGVQFPAGIKVKGAGTLIYAQKSLSIKLRAAYGQSSVTYPFFSDLDLHTFSSLCLRNSGQDISVARIRDSFFSRAVRGMNIDCAATRPAVVYINGAYYGLYDFNEDLNQDYLAGHYNVDPDNVNIVRRNETALRGTKTDFKRVRAYALNKNLANDALFAQFAEWVDVAYFTDYLIAQTYFANSDMFNQKYWRTNDYAVKWRPIYYDLDFGLSSSTRNIIAVYFREEGVPSNDGSLTYMDIYIGLRKNAAWRKMCAERYVELIMTQFNADRLTGILDEMAAVLRQEMPRQIARWGKPTSMSKWESSIATLRNTVIKRPANSLEQVRGFFGLSKSELQALVDKYR